MKIFEKDDAGYLRWVAANPDGFIVNTDQDWRSPDYPMVHRATHKALTSPNRNNYTTGRFFKLCSTDIRELEDWARDKRGRQLNPCRTCM